MASRIRLVLLAACLLGPAALALVAQRETSIEGRVVDAGSGKPIPGASVYLGVREKRATTASTTTDSAGRFTIRTPPPGAYDLWATHNGYRDGSYLQRSATSPGAVLQLNAGERLKQLQLRLWKQGAIGGRIVDEYAEPLTGLRVMALEYSWAFEPMRLVQSRAVKVVESNDRGEYRLANVPPGEYVIAVAGADTQHDLGRVTFSPAAYPTTYYPGVLSAEQASPIAVGAGEEVLGMNLTVAHREGPSGQVRVNLRGGPPDLVWTVELLPAPGSVPDDLAIRRAPLTPDRPFVFEHVSAGFYVVRATGFSELGNLLALGRNRVRVPIPPDPDRPIEMKPTYWAQTSTAMRGDEMVSVDLEPHLTAHIRGRLTFRGTTARPDDRMLLLFPVFVEALDGRQFFGASTGRVDLSGRFSTVGLPPGRYVLELSEYPGWYPDAMTINGRPSADGIVDLSDEDVEVTYSLTDTPTELVGAVRDSHMRPVADTAVFVFPTNRAMWRSFARPPVRVKQLRPDEKGNFRIVGLPPGEYYVAALTSDVPEQWQRPDFLAALVGQSIRTNLAPGSRRAIDVTAADHR